MNNRNRTHQTMMILLILLVGLLGSVTVHAQTAFTYQGRLTTGGQPAQGDHDVEFRLFDAATDGNQVGATLTENGLSVTDGVFSAVLDFGDGPFNSAPRWLQIDVRQAGGGAYTTLLPRQRVGASPFAIETLFVAPGAVDTAALQDGAVTEEKLAEESVTLGKLATGSVTSGAILNNQVSSVDIANGTIQRADLQDNLIGSSQIEDGTVASTDLRDGTITAVDLAAGFYRTKADLYEVVGLQLSIGASPLNDTVACVDANDLPIAGGCRASSNSQLIATSVSTSDWESTNSPASATCNGVNLTPSNPGVNRVEVAAYIVCVSVP